MELRFIEIPKLRKLENTKEIKEAKEELLRLSSDDKEKKTYEKRQESLLEQNSLLVNSERKCINSKKCNK